MKTDRPIRVLVVDDHSVVRMGLLNLLEGEADIEVVGEAADDREKLKSMQTAQPNVILIGVTMSRTSGIEVMEEALRVFPQVRILIFGTHNDPDYILSAAQKGAAGYLSKDTNRAEILKAIRAVHAGELYYPPGASSVIIRSLVGQEASAAAPESRPSASPSSIWQRITSRENQILQCLTEGMSSKEIARRFDVSPNTVANQRASIIRKARVRNTAELVSMALKEQRR